MSALSDRTRRVSFTLSRLDCWPRQAASYLAPFGFTVMSALTSLIGRRVENPDSKVIAIIEIFLPFSTSSLFVCRFQNVAH